MSRVAAFFAMAAMIAAPAFASMTDIDTDGDSLVTLTELAVQYPDVTDELFSEMDSNADGFLDETEMTAAIDAEMLIAPAQ